MSEGYDIVSDLNDSTIPAEVGDASHGADAVQVNNQAPPVREPTAQAKVVGEPAAATQDGEKPKSIRDLISGALKDPSATPDGAQQDGRTRNADGTFAPKPEIDPSAPPAVAAPVTAAPVGIDPTVFSSLPAETQATLARTMDDVHQRQQRFARLEPLEQLIAPRLDAWAMNGMQPAQAVHQLLALSDFASRDIQGFIKYMAQTNNVDLETMVLGMGAEEQVDPTIAAMQKEITALRGERTSEQRQQQQAAHNDRVNGVVAFASEKGQDGKPLRPYFDELGTEVLPFIAAVKAQNPQWPHTQVLQEAYDRACWGTPSVRSKMQATADAVRDAERLRQGAEKADAARAASVSVRSGAPTTPPAAPNEGNRSTRDTIKAAMAQHS